MKLSTEIFENEGKHNVTDTIRIVAEAVIQLDIDRVVIFAVSAQNVLELRRRLPDNCSLLAVTFPAGMTAHPADHDPIIMGIPSAEEREALAQSKIPICQGVMPLRGLGENISPAIEAMRRVFALFGGGTALCVQAVLMACDGGYLREGERCIVMSADTALVMRSGNAFRFMRHQSHAAIEHILCKPMNYQISRPQVAPEINVTETPSGGLESQPRASSIGEGEPKKTLPDSGSDSSGELSS